MTLEEFTELLGTYGADLSKWPHDRRAAAQELLAQSDAATTALAEAAKLDETLRRDGGELSPERRRGLVEGIMDSLDSDERAGSAAEDAGAAQRGTK